MKRRSQTISATGRTYTVHTTDDPALGAMEPSEIVVYSASRKAADLGELDGEPVSFVFRRMTRDQRLFAESAPTEAEREERAFMAGIQSIAGGFWAEEAGPEPWAPHALGTPLYTAMTEDELAYVEGILGPAAIRDVGSVIYVRSWLRPKAEPVFPRPRTSLLAWDALPCRFVGPGDISPQSSAEPNGVSA